MGKPHKHDVCDPSLFPEVEMKRLNKMLAHLSFSRPKYIRDGLDAWHVPQMTADLLRP